MKARKNKRLMCKFKGLVPCTYLVWKRAKAGAYLGTLSMQGYIIDCKSHDFLFLVIGGESFVRKYIIFYSIYFKLNIHISQVMNFINFAIYGLGMHDAKCRWRRTCWLAFFRIVVLILSYRFFYVLHEIHRVRQRNFNVAIAVGSRPRPDTK